MLSLDGKISFERVRYKRKKDTFIKCVVYNNNDAV